VEAIRDVLIIHDTVTMVSGGETAWEYTTDIGVVFDLSASAVAVAEGLPPPTPQASHTSPARGAARSRATSPYPKQGSQGQYLYMITRVMR
jgi:hypothetical protein